MLLGGLVLATAERMVRIEVPAVWHCVLAHPDQVLETRRAREALKGHYALGEFVAQSANLAQVIIGCLRGDEGGRAAVPRSMREGSHGQGRHGRRHSPGAAPARALVSRDDGGLHPPAPRDESHPDPLNAARLRSGRENCGAAPLLESRAVVGGLGRNRTGVRGFAVRCMTTLPPGRRRSPRAAAHGSEGDPEMRNPGEPGPRLRLERETRLELATPTLARSCSTN